MLMMERGQVIDSTKGSQRNGDKQYSKEGRREKVSGQWIGPETLKKLKIGNNY